MSIRGLKFKFSVAEEVLCFEPDPSKARVLYDAKILEQIPSSTKDGSRIPEYHVHFQGWKNSWDRIVNESFILEDDEANRSLMKRIAEMSRRYHNNRQRIRRIDETLRRSRVKKPKFNGDVDSSSDEEDVVGEEMSSESEVQSEEDEDVDLEESYIEDAEPLELVIPDELKDILSADNDCILRQKLLVKLPAVPNIVSILETYVAYFIANNPLSIDPNNNTAEKSVTVCKEMVDGLRVLFDFLLPIILLYSDERAQYEKIRSTFVYRAPLKIVNHSAPPLIKREFDSCEIDADAKPSYFGERVRRISERLSNNSPPVMTENNTKHSHIDTKSSNQPNKTKSSKKSTKKAKKISAKCDITKVNKSNVNDAATRRRITRSLSESTLDMSDIEMDADVSFKNPSVQITPLKDKYMMKSVNMKRVRCRKKGHKWSVKKIRTAGSNNFPKTGVNCRNLTPQNASLKRKSMSTTKRINKPLGYGVNEKMFNKGRLKKVKDVIVDVESNDDSLNDVASPVLDVAVDDSIVKASIRLRNLSGRDTPPPPLLKRNSISNDSNQTCSDDTVALKGRTLPSGTHGWSLLPLDVLTKRPPLPSVIYGAHHLLRLFVKLPDIITEMKLRPDKQSILQTHFILFLLYLLKERERLFTLAAYVSS